MVWKLIEIHSLFITPSSRLHFVLSRNGRLVKNDEERVQFGENLELTSIMRYKF